MRMVIDVKGIQWYLAYGGFRVLRKEKLRPKEVDNSVQHQPAQKCREENE